MANTAMATMQKITKKCPNCGTDGLKELVSGPKRTDWIMVVVLLCLTGGLGLLKISWWRKSSLEAFCPNCNKSFNPGSF